MAPLAKHQIYIDFMIAKNAKKVSLTAARGVFCFDAHTDFGGLMMPKRGVINRIFDKINWEFICFLETSMGRY